MAVNLMALLTRLIRICRMRPGSPTTCRGTSGAIRMMRSSPFSAAAPESSSPTSSTATMMSKGTGSSRRRPASIFEKSRMSLMIVRSASADFRTVSAWCRWPARQLRVEQETGHADDAVHRGPDLVAHAGQELRLEPRGFESPVARGRELGLHLLSLGDVPEHAREEAPTRAPRSARTTSPAAPPARPWSARPGRDSASCGAGARRSRGTAGGRPDAPRGSAPGSGASGTPRPSRPRCSRTAARPPG